MQLNEEQFNHLLTCWDFLVKATMSKTLLTRTTLAEEEANLKMSLSVYLMHSRPMTVLMCCSWRCE
jgi:hypothetical protein